MSEFIRLEAEKRVTTGKQVKAIRREGKVPVVIYGPEIDALTLTVNARELRYVLLEAGGTQLIEIQVNGEKIPTLAREVQRDSIRGDILHVDFYRVSMTRVISAEVPLHLVGEAPAVATGEAILVHALNSVTVEALPIDLPQFIEVDLGALAKVGDQITVAELVPPEKVTILTDKNELIVKADYAAVQEEEVEGALFEETPEVEVIRERKAEAEE
jgi:large subunit ribosomal protein L25